MSGAEFAKFANDLLRASTGIDKMGERAAERVGQGALKAARSVAPVDRGDLRSSLTMRRDGTRAVVSSSLYYAAIQEFGTSQMAPNPFIGPAATQWGPRLFDEVQKIADEVVKKL